MWIPRRKDKRIYMVELIWYVYWHEALTRYHNVTDIPMDGRTTLQ